MIQHMENLHTHTLRYDVYILIQKREIPPSFCLQSHFCKLIHMCIIYVHVNVCIQRGREKRGKGRKR